MEGMSVVRRKLAGSDGVVLSVDDVCTHIQGGTA